MTFVSNGDRSMAQHLIPFGVGTRLCGGQNLVQIMLRVIIAVIVKNFNISANLDETNEQTMEIRDAFVGFLLRVSDRLAS